MGKPAKPWDEIAKPTVSELHYWIGCLLRDEKAEVCSPDFLKFSHDYRDWLLDTSGGAKAMLAEAYARWGM